MAHSSIRDGLPSGHPSCPVALHANQCKIKLQTHLLALSHQFPFLCRHFAPAFVAVAIWNDGDVMAAGDDSQLDHRNRSHLMSHSLFAGGEEFAMEPVHTTDHRSFAHRSLLPCGVRYSGSWSPADIGMDGRFAVVSLPRDSRSCDYVRCSSHYLSRVCSRLSNRRRQVPALSL